jgi:hypothetical protein
VQKLESTLEPAGFSHAEFQGEVKYDYIVIDEIVEIPEEWNIENYK